MSIALFPSNTMLSKVKGRIAFNKFVLQSASSWKHQAPCLWHISYCSLESFDKNKQLGFYSELYVEKPLPLLPLLTPSIFSRRLLQSFSTCGNFVQHRNFRNKRKEEQSSKTWSYSPLNLFAPKDVEVKVPNSIGQIPVETIEAIQKVYLQGLEQGRNKQHKKRLYFVVFLVMAALVVSLIRFTDRRISEIEPKVSVTFDDIKGLEEAKKELQTLVDFLRNKEKFERMGAKLPSGVLLCGQPGTGKTMLAKAVAGEAGVPFFYSCGSQFDEGLVGDGARKVRELFNAARESAPSVIFLDEFDSVGGRRTSSRLHPYANQTINQLLTEMDGFKTNDGVVILAATNRPRDLDPALVRPGRFDMSITVALPMEEARVDLLKHYLAKISYKDIELELMAKKTAGFTGASIANMINMAAIIAVLENSTYVTMEHLQEAYSRVRVGSAWIRQSKSVQEDKRKTAYHEAGHVLVSHFSKHGRTVSGVTIKPRGSTRGYTSYYAREGIITKADMTAMIDSSVGGQAAEEMIFGPEGITTGCTTDLKTASQLAIRMVRLYGMTGVNLIVPEEETYHTLSEESRKVVDIEVNRILEESRDRVRTLLSEHKDDLEKLVENLVKFETLNDQDVRRILGPPASEKNVQKKPEKNVQKKPEKNVQKKPEQQDKTHLSVSDEILRSKGQQINTPSVS